MAKPKEALSPQHMKSSFEVMEKCSHFKLNLKELLWPILSDGVTSRLS